MARFVVTGTPRTATGYASLFFRALSLPCTHERIFRPRATLADVLEWYTHKDHGESSWLAWAFLGLLPGPVPVLHQTRNPWAVVDSLAYRNDLIPVEARSDPDKAPYRNVVDAYCPDVAKYEQAVDRAAAFILAWNKLIMGAVAHYECPYLRYRVEDMDAAQTKALLEVVGVYRDSYEIETALTSVPRNVNAGEYLEHNIEVTNPQLRALLNKLAPELPPVIAQARRQDMPRSAEELEKSMDPELRNALRELAAEHGYTRNGSGTSVYDKGVMTNVIS